jgi:hypothetical protein
MKKQPTTEKMPVTQPAPQLPNIPASPDDPFQSDIERQANVPDPDGSLIPPQLVSRPLPQKKRNADEELPTVL